ncbi:hypothetical protein [Brachyspira hampsonii]|uniref:Uncharacterized protein n=1 Tax=Brachyspira hampsonii 30446 TaxID=1289135 RepID=A0A2U4FPG8_9SPIR|nr:hypothetical protein [Brachyspira hampsonii]EKV57033.1 hypothetical protein A966_08339 [Brachyspira hampsonii 30446]MBW5389990.1 hypothetical protein [Brachyspira hampsonii]MBW5395592.1 hypothetical protein [Brachyspira hampsonii]OEJ19249.1 hypothetical protein A9495_04790 [Brachyspira hampsonii]
MKRALFVILSILFILILFNTCNSHFNPRYYYQEMSRNNSTSDNTAEPDIGGESILSADEDPFVYDAVSKAWNDPNYRGFTLDLDNDYVIAASFGLKNEPTYMLIKDDTWKINDPLRNEYYYDGTNTKAAGFTVSKVKYYMYKNMNPTFSSSSAYNKSDRLKRFWFYRFTGSAGLDTDNYLIAIDSYSKLVFAFAVPTKWKTIFGIPAPVEWGAVELGWEASADSVTLNSQVKFAVDGFTYFYEYDPVGIVHSDGTIEIYPWCTSSIANDNSYAPIVEGGKIDLSRNIASNGSPGRSPYMPIKTVKKNKIALQVQNLEIENISAKSFNDRTIGSDEYLNYAGFRYDMRIANTINGTETLNTIASKDKPSLFFDSLFKVNIGETKSILSTIYTLDIEYEDKDKNSISISLDCQISMYDKKGISIGTEAVITDYDSPSINFTYDSNQDAFIFKDINGANSTKIVEYTQGFTLKKGETKVFYAVIEDAGIGESNGAEASGRIKLIYTLYY